MKEQSFGPILFIEGENKGRYPFCHSLFIENEGVLIDPASDRERLIRLKEDRKVKTIWLSHWHEDHFMYLDIFDDIPLWISQKDSPPLSDMEVFLDWYGIDNEEYRNYWRDVLKKQFHYRPRRPINFLRGGETVELGSVKVEIISTPGHTPGNLSFFFPDFDLLFIGDYDLTRFGPWYGDTYSSIEETINSVNYLRNLRAKYLIASHEDGVFLNESERPWEDYLQIIEKRERKLLDLLEKPRAINEIVDAWIVYGRPREPKAFFEFGERALMKKHLERLINLGKVMKENDRYIKI